jgi:thiamine biosynthesis protein ThiI
MEKFVIVHYHEIALKGKNRIFFEKKLVSNIQKVLQNQEYSEVKRIFGRIVIKLNEKSDFAKIKEKLFLVFGIAYFCEAWFSDSQIETLQKNIFDLVRKRKFRSFKIQARRSQKKYLLTSQEVNEKIGAFVLENFSGKIKVDLEKPDLTCFVEITERGAFIYFDKIKGSGGLPSGSSGKIVSLISSGFDSPLAAWKMMRRGAKITFLHFHSYPHTSRASIENVKRLVLKITPYQFESSLCLVPFVDIQKEIMTKTMPQIRVVLYRRMMVRIAETLARKVHAGALVTGESLGQVASQTLENIFAINRVATLPVFRPLISEDKEEIINETKKISTYEISSLPYEDCCSLFVPQSPATKASLEKVEAEEKKLDIEKMVERAVEGMEKVELKISE